MIREDSFHRVIILKDNVLGRMRKDKERSGKKLHIKKKNNPRFPSNEPPMTKMMFKMKKKRKAKRKEKKEEQFKTLPRK